MLAVVFLLAPQVKSLSRADEQQATPGASAKKQTAVVTLTVDYGDGAQKRFPAIPWKAKMNVVNALDWAGKHPRGIKFTQRGRGALTMITQIDDLKNGGADDRNWVFRVNDKLGDRSSGIFELKAGDRVLWKFERYK